MKSYLGVIGNYECEYIVERSRFITYICGVEDEEHAKKFVADIKKKNSLATHNCYAYVADENGLVRKFSDDGEPQGTAGMPMLEVLKNKNLRKTAVVVTRYFGGIKLGAGGLVRAYAKATTDGVNGCKTAEFIYSACFEIVFDYDKYSKFIKFNENRKTVVFPPEFSDNVTVKVAIPEEDGKKYLNDLTDYFGGKISIHKKENKYFPYEVL